MLSFKEACRIAYEQYTEKGHEGLTDTALDTENEWIFMCYLEKIMYGGVIPLGVNKNTGKARWVSVPEYSDMMLKDVSFDVTVEEEFLHETVKQRLCKRNQLKDN